MEQGGDVKVRNKRGRTPLHTAALFQRAFVLEVLLKAGADVDAQDVNGDTPLRKHEQLLGCLCTAARACMGLAHADGTNHVH